MENYFILSFPFLSIAVIFFLAKKIPPFIFLDIRLQIKRSECTYEK